MRSKHILLISLISALPFLSGCLKEESVEIHLKAEDAIPPSHALGSSYSCEEIFTMPIENTTARAKKWTSLYKDVGIAVYECKDEKHAKEVLQEGLEEELKGYEMKEMVYKGKKILYNESERVRNHFYPSQPLHSYSQQQLWKRCKERYIPTA